MSLAAARKLKRYSIDCILIQIKVQTANKRAAEVGKAVKKNEPVQKKSKPLPAEEPTIDENSFVIKDEVPPEQMIAEKDSEEEKKVEEVAQETSGETETIAQETVTNGGTEEAAEE